ncbi:MAG: hypothetical protein QF864_11510 [SAR202 cluster bacterium]|jgi:hypothetical protein|nr:hypothetical protein [SAR202 cluster bacterium]
MENQQPKRSIKGPIIIIGIVLLIIVALFAVPFGFIYFKSKAQCGEGGMLIGSANKGYYCGYQSICEDCQNASQCPSSSQLCESKGKISRDGYCGPNKIDLTNKIKRDSEGNIYIEEGPINCYSCCDEKGGN